MKKNEMYHLIEEGTILEHLEEIGRISVDQLGDIDLDLLVEVLDSDFSLPCNYEHLPGGFYLVNEHFEENRK